MKDILFFTSQSEEMLNVKYIGISIEGLQNGKVYTMLYQTIKTMNFG
jgi:hypothetical protein